MLLRQPAGRRCRPALRQRPGAAVAAEPPGLVASAAGFVAGADGPHAASRPTPGQAHSCLEQRARREIPRSIVMGTSPNCGANSRRGHRHLTDEQPSTAVHFPCVYHRIELASKATFWSGQGVDPA